MCSQGPSKQAVLEWCLPIVHDCLGEFYAQHFPPRAAGLRLLIAAQFKLWTSLVRGDGEAARADFMLLLQRTAALRLDFEVRAAADRYVAAELLDLSLRRFRRMPEEAKTTSHALLNLLKQLDRNAAPTSLAYRRAA